LFVVLQGVGQTGWIIGYDQSFTKLDTFLTISNIATGGEEGLLSLVFHPQYENIASPFYGFFYVYYTNSSGNLEIARYKVSANPNIADPASKDTVLTIPHPGNSNHNGGTLHFGNDGYLYLAVGDGGSAGDPPNNAQNPAVLLGKMIRIDVNSSAVAPFYTSPPGNPYFGITTPDTLDQIYAFGLRNPFRWSFDRQTNDIWIGDVGQGGVEEIDFRRADSTARTNYGWRCYEGDNDYNTSGCGPRANYTFPVFTYPNTGSAVVGGVVYRGTLPANAPLVGYYIAADYYSGRIYKIRPNGAGGWTVYTQNGAPTNFSNFGETEDGEILAVRQFGSNIYTITVDAVLPARLIDFSARAVGSAIQVNWKTTFEENFSRFEIEYSEDGINFRHAGTVAATNIATGADYTFTHSGSFAGRILYRLKMINIDNSHEYSSTVSTEVRLTYNNFVRPSVITSGTLTLYLDKSFNTLELINMEGSVISRQEINGRTGRIDITVPVLSRGIYIARLRSNELTLQQKVIFR
jgi:hypothetical protein